MKTKKRGFVWAKWITYFAGILVPISLVIFPNFFLLSEERIRVVASLTMFLVVGLVFAVEDVKTFLVERHEELLSRVTSLQESVRDEGVFRSMQKLTGADPLFYKHMSSNWNTFKERLKQAELGVLRLEECEMATYPCELAESVQKSLYATCVWIDDPFGSKKRAAYLDKLHEAHQRHGVTVMRLFIVSAADKASEAFRTRLLEEKRRGFTNKCIAPEEWVGTGLVKQPVDFGIWDEKRVWVFTGERLPSGRHSAELHNAETTVKEYRAAFDANWNEAASCH